MPAAETLRGAVDSLANSRGRSARHLMIGLGLTVGAVLASAMVAKRTAPAPENPKAWSEYQKLEKPKFTPPRAMFGIVWPPLFLMLTLSGLRIWNAPKSAARSQALVLWTFAQALNALWMALGPKRLGGQLATATAAIGTAGAYVWRAGKVDKPAAGLVSPYVGWIGFAGALTEELWRKNEAKPTLH
jgi:tryptophan-rich sensory protein